MNGKAKFLKISALPAVACMLFFIYAAARKCRQRGRLALRLGAPGGNLRTQAPIRLSGFNP